MEKEEIHLNDWVKRFYLEASGSFTLIKEKEQRAGMNILPDWDADFNNEQKQDTTKVVCGHCGSEKTSSQNTVCNNCYQQRWMYAIN